MKGKNSMSTPNKPAAIDFSNGWSHHKKEKKNLFKRKEYYTVKEHMQVGRNGPWYNKMCRDEDYVPWKCLINKYFSLKKRTLYISVNKWTAIRITTTPCYQFLI